MLSVETLLKKIQGQKVKCRQILKPKLVVRESCQAKNLSAVNTRIKKKEIKTEHKINV
jgi:hypothetical protein